MLLIFFHSAFENIEMILLMLRNIVEKIAVNKRRLRGQFRIN